MTNPPDRGGERSLVARILRFAAGVLLLFGPLVATELWTRSQAEWLRPVLRDFHVAMDMKLVLLEQRDRCPDLVTLGTSLTDNGLPPRYLEDKQIGRRTIRDPFDFALPEVRATNMLAQYRWLRRHRCKPRWLFVEFSPFVVNREHGGPAHDPALLDLGSLVAMPDGFAEHRGYTLADELELITYDRLLIERRRERIAERWLDEVDGERWFMSVSEREAADEAEAARRAELEAKARARGEEPAPEPEPEPDEIELEWDGKLSGIRRGQSERRWRREQRRRPKMFEDGTYKWHYAEVERLALERLVREAAADGVTVVLHSPPVTSLYRELTDQLGMETDFAELAAFVDALAAELPKVVAYNAHADERYGWKYFFDWVHLASPGSRRYIKRLLHASTRALRAEAKSKPKPEPEPEPERAPAAKPG